MGHYFSNDVWNKRDIVFRDKLEELTKDLALASSEVLRPYVEETYQRLYEILLKGDSLQGFQEAVRL